MRSCLTKMDLDSCTAGGRVSRDSQVSLGTFQHTMDTLTSLIALASLLCYEVVLVDISSTLLEVLDPEEVKKNPHLAFCTELRIWGGHTGDSGNVLRIIPCTAEAHAYVKAKLERVFGKGDDDRFAGLIKWDV